MECMNLSRTHLSILGVVTLWTFLPATATAAAFTSTFTFNNTINVSTFLNGNSFTGFNYGATQVLQDQTLAGQSVKITSLDLTATALSHGPVVNFDWLALIGPASFGLTPGQVTNSPVFPGPLDPNSTAAPVDVHFVVGRLTSETGVTLSLNDSYNYLTGTSTRNPNSGGVDLSGTYSNPLTLGSGLFAEVYIWSEDGQAGGTNIDFSNIQLTVQGTTASAVPEPGSLTLLAGALLYMVGWQKRKALRHSFC